MGNTKYIWFAGEFKKEEEITEAKLIEWAHGTYACLKEDVDGYLGLSKSFKWVQGLVHTSSTAGANIIEYFLLKMVHGSIGLHDATQGWYVYYDIYDGEIEAQKAISLSSVPGEVIKLDDLKQIIRLAIDVHVPDIIVGKSEIERLTKEKRALQAQIDVLNIELEECETQVAGHQDWLMGIMETHDIKKIATPRYAIERCRNANPTIEVIDLAMVPKRYIVETPRVDKRYIQSEYSVNRIIPPGIAVKYGQYLEIVERRK